MGRFYGQVSSEAPKAWAQKNVVLGLQKQGRDRLI
jgi:hypothetical protein